MPKQWTMEKRHSLPSKTKGLGSGIAVSFSNRSMVESYTKLVLRKYKTKTTHKPNFGCL